MSNWKSKLLGELCDKGGGRVQTGPFGSQLHQSDYSEEGIPVVMPADIIQGKISEERIARVSEAHVERLKKHKLRYGDIVYGRRGDIGRQALARDENVGWLCGTGCLKVSLGNSEVIPEFLHYYLSTQEVIGWIAGQAIGATMPNLNTDILRRVPVRFPPLKEQRKIASILSAYDDLIENNKRRIALLEKMAEEIYREWFVRMRFSSFAEASDDKPGNEKVKGLPKGWGLIKIDQLAKEVRDGIKKQDLSDETLYVGLEHLPRKSISLKEWTTADTVNSNKLRFQKRDILFGKIRPYLHKLVLSHVAGACSTDTIVLRPTNTIYEGFILFTLFSESFVELATIASKGTKMPRADWDFLKKQQLPVPPVTALKQYQDIFETCFAEVGILLAQNQRLQDSRDLLLPRLISGKLSVENISLDPVETAEQMTSQSLEAAHA